MRFIGNRSSGKMGAAIAEAARDRGAAVTLIAGAMSVTPPRGVTVMNPYTESAVQGYLKGFLNKYFDDDRPRVAILREQGVKENNR